ncbi:PqqD family protein [Arthrobacter globiformis]|uniref:PqqD family protein n=1 Tax=Arthrobacter globiformis TaxID=1665 RepID=UPI000B40A88F|nr:PqqD family protein [Arthrobacter globiformis]
MVWKHSSLVAEVRHEAPGRVALLHLDATQPVVLAGPAEAIWHLIDGRRDETEVIAELQAGFEDKAGELVRQSLGFLESLESQRLIEAADEARQ